MGPERTGAVDPMGGLDVVRVIATGGSQSAMRLVAYANAVHPLDPVVDGFLLSVWEGRAPRLMAGGEDFYYVTTTLRDDLTAPTVIVNSEFEVLPLAGLPIEDHEYRRLWEVTGTPHGNWPGAVRPDEKGVIPNPLSYQPVLQAALRQLHHWLADGIPAPHQPRIQHVLEPRPAIVARFVGKRARRGAAPRGRGADARAPGRRVRHGLRAAVRRIQPFTDDELRGALPVAGGVRHRWDDAVDRLVASGTLRQADADAMKARGDTEAGRLPVSDG